MLNKITSQDELDIAVEKLLPGDLIVLTAPSWCMPCKRLQPHLEALGQKMNIMYIDIDKVPEYSKHYDIRSVPVIYEWQHQGLRTINGRTIVQIEKELI
jgi:thioredoxin-like negative regulator of GroEL